MTKYQYFRALENELAELNRAIDRKIVLGLKYNEEAKKHKMLVRKVKFLRGKALLTRMFTFATN